MVTPGLLLLTAFALLFAMVGKRLASTVLTAPMVFISFGYLLARTGWLPATGAEMALHVVAEVASVLLLFLDASQIDLQALRRQHRWPARMLAVGPAGPVASSVALARASWQRQSDPARAAPAAPSSPPRVARYSQHAQRVEFD